MVNVILGVLQVRRDSVYIKLTNFNVRRKWHGPNWVSSMSQWR